jgi:hypothetical protein
MDYQGATESSMSQGPGMSKQLEHVRMVLASGAQLPPHSAAWLVRSIDRMLAGDDPRMVLGLDHASAVRERDRIIRGAARELSGSTWARAKHLAEQIHRHQSGRCAEAWVRQASAACKLPTTPERILQIIR